MSDEPVPMLNRPKESTCETAEQFAQNVLGRMDRAHGSFIATTRIAAEPPEEARARMEKFREEVFRRYEALTGLTFDRETGQCTTQTTVEMEGPVKARWGRLCQQMGTEKDPQKGEELLRELGRIVRGEAETPDVTPTDS
jgi:hypothetical protein